MGKYSNLPEEIERQLVQEYVREISDPDIPRFRKNRFETMQIAREMDKWHEIFCDTLHHDEEFNPSNSRPIALLCLKLLKDNIPVDDPFTRFQIGNFFFRDRLYVHFKGSTFGKKSAGYFHEHAGEYWIKEGYFRDAAVYRRIK